MRAAVLVRPKKIELTEIETPKPSRGEVLIRIGAALTCGTDLKAFIRGHPVIPMPGLFGHEFSGVIAEVGKGVGGFKTGDEIMAVHSAPCLKCPYCRKRIYNLCENIMDKKVLGAFSEYILLPSHIVKQNLFPKPPNLSFGEAAFLEPLSCVVHGMSGLNIKKGESVLIFGAGPIGLLHLLLAKLKGARVIVTGLEKERLNIAKKLGVDMAVLPEGLIKALAEFMGGHGVDYVFECTGSSEVWERSVGYVRRGGIVVLFGGCKSGTKVTYDAHRLHYDEITLRGVFHFSPKDVREAYRLLRDEKVRVAPLITAGYPLNEIGEAFARLEKGEGVKYAIIP